MDLSKFNTALTVLVDMDETLVEFEKEFWRRWYLQFPYTEGHCTPGFDFDLRKCVPEKYADKVKAIWNDVGFFQCLEPIPGALQAMNEMRDQGINVMICSSPSFARTWSCKAIWVKENLGVDWVDRLILTRDKTGCKGNYLIDDKPEITGAFHPEWQHIMFDRPFNRKDKYKDARRLTNWAEWRNIFSQETDKKLGFQRIVDEANEKIWQIAIKNP